MAKLQPITQVPAGFVDAFAKINAAIAQLNAIAASEGVGSVKIIKGQANWIIEGSGGGTGLPAGYTFEEFTICVDGTPETRWWPTWTANPEA